MEQRNNTVANLVLELPTVRDSCLTRTRLSDNSDDTNYPDPRTIVQVIVSYSHAILWYAATQVRGFAGAQARMLSGWQGAD